MLLRDYIYILHISETQTMKWAYCMASVCLCL